MLGLLAEASSIIGAKNDCIWLNTAITMPGKKRQTGDAAPLAFRGLTKDSIGLRLLGKAITRIVKASGLLTDSTGSRDSVTSFVVPEPRDQ
jgi:hypothetical protein